MVVYCGQPFERHCGKNVDTCASRICGVEQKHMGSSPVFLCVLTTQTFMLYSLSECEAHLLMETTEQQMTLTQMKLKLNH